MDDNASDSLLNWDRNRFMTEMWLPMRKISPSPSPKSPDSTKDRFITRHDILFETIVYKLAVDWIDYGLSHYTVDQVQLLPTVRFGLFVSAGGLMIMFMTLWPIYFTAWIYDYRYGGPLDLNDWTMLTNPLPCFATNPSDFWLNWHTLLRYIWVDLGFLPMQQFCRRFLTGDRIGIKLAKMLEEVLPVMTVFTWSGIMHAYIVYAVWRDSVWSQLSFFWIQGLAVVMAKAIERSAYGRWIQRKKQESIVTRKLMDTLGWIMMIWFHVATVPFFVHPYLNSGMWLDIKELSPVWWVMPTW